VRERQMCSQCINRTRHQVSSPPRTHCRIPLQHPVVLRQTPLPSVVLDRLLASPLPLPTWRGVGYHQMGRSWRTEKRSYRLPMGPTSGLGMRGRRAVHRIPVGERGRRGHNKRPLLPVLSRVSRKRRRIWDALDSPETWQWPAT
jgi:hypothetical protein